MRFGIKTFPVKQMTMKLRSKDSGADPAGWRGEPVKLYHLLGVFLLVAAAAIISFSYGTAKEMTGLATGAAENVAKEIASVMREKAFASAREALVARASAKAFQIRARFEQALGVAGTLAEVFAGMKGAGVAVDVGRDSVNSMLQTILADNGEFFAAYTVWEPELFDMLDLAYVNAPGHDRTGRFIPYWYRGPRGVGSLIAAGDYGGLRAGEGSAGKGGYYQVPKVTKSAHIIDPVEKTIGGRGHLVVSVVAPIMLEDRFLGVAGIDLTLGFLQTLAEEMAASLFMGEGRVMCISHNGTIAAWSGQADMVGGHISLLGKGWEKILETVRSGAAADSIEDGELMVFTPLKLGDTRTPWSVNVVVKEAVIRMEAEAFHRKMLADARRVNESLRKESGKALWKQMTVAGMLALATLLIVKLTRTLERKEGALRTSETRLQAMLDHTSAVIYMKDRKGRYLLANRTFERNFGMKVAHIVGRCDGDLFPGKFAERFRENDRRVMREGEAIQIEESVPQAAGIRTYLSIKFPIHDSAGAVHCVCGISTDITERKEAENELVRVKNDLDNIIDAMPSALVGVDAQERITHWNLEAARMIGRTREMAVGLPLKEVAPKLSDLMETVRGPLREGRAEKIENQVCAEGGMPRYSDFVFYPLGGEGRSGCVLRIDDVTRRVAIEKRITRLNEELEERVKERTLDLSKTNQALGESLAELKKAQAYLVQSEKMASLGLLVAGVAHEVNTPIGIGVTGITYVTERIRALKTRYRAGALSRKEFEEILSGLTEMGETIHTSLDRAAELIQNFKQVAVDQTRYDRETFNIRHYLAIVLSSLRPKLKRTNPTIIVNCPAELSLNSYPGAFSQIVTNLVTNSLLHGFDGTKGGKIVFDVRRKADGIEMKYADQGRGILPADLPKVFDPFFTTRRGKGGTGLGLHIIYNIIHHKIGGTIRCESPPGKGAVFTIDFPAETVAGDP